MPDCIFCKISSGQVPSAKIWENETHFAFLDNQPIKPGHTLVIPKKHTDYIFDLSDGEYETLLLKSKAIAKKLKAKLAPKRVGMAVEGFGVAHVHVHLVPINHGAELNPLDARPALDGELERIAKMLIEQ